MPGLVQSDECRSHRLRKFAQRCRNEFYRFALERIQPWHRGVTDRPEVSATEFPGCGPGIDEAAAYDHIFRVQSEHQIGNMQSKSLRLKIENFESQSISFLRSLPEGKCFFFW